MLPFGHCKLFSLCSICFPVDTVTDDTNTFVGIEGWTASGLKLRDVVNCTLCCKGASPFETTNDHTYGTFWARFLRF